MGHQDRLFQKKMKSRKNINAIKPELKEREGTGTLLKLARTQSTSAFTSTTQNVSLDVGLTLNVTATADGFFAYSASQQYTHDSTSSGERAEVRLNLMLDGTQINRHVTVLDKNRGATAEMSGFLSVDAGVTYQLKMQAFTISDSGGTLTLDLPRSTQTPGFIQVLFMPQS